MFHFGWLTGSYCSLLRVVWQQRIWQSAVHHWNGLYRPKLCEPAVTYALIWQILMSCFFPAMLKIVIDFLVDSQLTLSYSNGGIWAFISQISFDATTNHSSVSPASCLLVKMLQRSQHFMWDDDCRIYAIFGYFITAQIPHYRSLKHIIAQMSLTSFAFALVIMSLLQNIHCI